MPADCDFPGGCANDPIRDIPDGVPTFRLMNLDTLLSSLRGNSYSSFPFFLIRRPEGFVGVFLNTLCPADVQIHDGETNPLGTAVVSEEHDIGHMFHTWFRALGIDSATTQYDNAGQPLPIAHDEQSAIAAVLA